MGNSWHRFYIFTWAEDSFANSLQRVIIIAYDTFMNQNIKVVCRFVNGIPCPSGIGRPQTADGYTVC
jgi:hypothetical protein